MLLSVRRLKYSCDMRAFSHRVAVMVVCLQCFLSKKNKLAMLNVIFFKSAKPELLNILIN